jgi:hypothetical protein
MAAAKGVENQALTLVAKGAYSEAMKLLEDYELEVLSFYS